jgi:hypothetical protein
MKPGKPSKIPNPFLFALYRSSLRFYPWRLRLLYQDEFLQTARDAHADSTSSLWGGSKDKKMTKGSRLHSRSTWLPEMASSGLTPEAILDA